MTTSRLFRLALLTWLGSLLLVIAGAVVSLKIPSSGLYPNHTVGSRLAMNWDGEWYEKIVTQGYRFDTKHRSSIVFFPVYPLLARALHVAGIPLHEAMLLTSNLLLACAYGLFVLYLDGRVGMDLSGEKAIEIRRFAVLALGLLPSTLFFHVAYTESTTLLLMMLSMYGMDRRWHPVWVAILIGAATAARATGIALLLPFAWYLWQWANTSDPPASEGGFLSITYHRVLRFLTWAPLGLLAVWGLVGFMIYQKLHFGAPLAFMQAQMVWSVRQPVDSPTRRLINLATFESIWATYLPGTALYWNRFSCRNVPLLNMYFLNPIYFLGTAVLVVLGRHRRWLNTPELFLSGMLLAIPYLAQSNRQGMVSEARFTSIVFPVYLVMGYLLASFSRQVAYALLALGGIFLFSYSALFCAGYQFY